jgi:hypothetical protein
MDGGAGGSPSTFYDCTAKDSSGKFINAGKPCASRCGDTLDPSTSIDWLYAYNDGTCTVMGLGTRCVCNWTMVDTCGSTMGSTCTAADSGVTAQCGNI